MRWEPISGPYTCSRGTGSPIPGRWGIFGDKSRGVGGQQTIQQPACPSNDEAYLRSLGREKRYLYRVFTSSSFRLYELWGKEGLRNAPSKCWIAAAAGNLVNVIWPKVLLARQRPRPMDHTTAAAVWGAGLAPKLVRQKAGVWTKLPIKTRVIVLSHPFRPEFWRETW